MVNVIRDECLPVLVAAAWVPGEELVLRMHADLITEEGAQALTDVLTALMTRTAVAWRKTA